MAGRTQKRSDVPADNRPAIDPAQPEPLEIEGGLDSPARRLQSMLEHEWDHDTDEMIEERWPLHKTIAFVTVTCGLFWAVAIFLGARLFQG